MLEGDLSDFTLPDILRLLAFTAKTGRLHLEGDRFHGRVDLIEGRVRDASADAKHLPLARRLIGLGQADGDRLVATLKGREGLPTDLELARDLVRDNALDPGQAASLLREQTVDAVFDLLRWERGSFRFEMRTEVDTSPPDLDLKVDDLLAEADQRLDAWPGIEQRTGSGQSVVTISRPSGATPDIDADGWGLLSLIDGHRTVDDLVALSGRGQYETRRTLGTLVDVGVVTIGEGGRGGAVDRLIADHRALEQAETSLQAFAPAERGPSGDGQRSSAPAPGERPSGEVLAEPASAQRAPSEGWQEAPREPAPPSDAPSSPSMAAPSEGAEASAPAAQPGAPEPRADAPRAEPTEPPATSPQPAPERDDNLRMRVRSDRLTTDPSVDADLVSRLIDGVEGM